MVVQTSSRTLFTPRNQRSCKLAQQIYYVRHAGVDDVVHSNAVVVVDRRRRRVTRRIIHSLDTARTQTCRSYNCEPITHSQPAVHTLRNCTMIIDIVLVRSLSVGGSSSSSASSVHRSGYISGQRIRPKMLTWVRCLCVFCWAHNRLPFVHI